MRRRLTLAGVAALLVALTACSPEQRAGFEWANATRARHGVAPLVWSEDLADFAQARADALAAGTTAGHLPDTWGSQVTGSWDLLAELLSNAVGFDAALDGYRVSTAHRTVLLRPRYTHVGIGVATTTRSVLGRTQPTTYIVLILGDERS